MDVLLRPQMQLPLQGLPGRKRTVAVALQGARSGNRPPQRLPIEILSGAIGHPVEIGIGDVLSRAAQFLLVGGMGGREVGKRTWAGRTDGSWGTCLSLVTV